MSSPVDLICTWLFLLSQVKGRQTVFTRAGFREDTTLTHDKRRDSVISSSSTMTRASKPDGLGKDD